MIDVGPKHFESRAKHLVDLRSLTAVFAAPPPTNCCQTHGGGVAAFCPPPASKEATASDNGRKVSSCFTRAPRKDPRHHRVEHRLTASNPNSARLAKRMLTSPSASLEDSELVARSRLSVMVRRGRH